MLRRAFLDLQLQKPIQQIPVRELCARAGVSRATFYTHYRDVYDLREQLEEEMLRGFAETLAPLFSRLGQELTPLAVTTGVFTCLQQNSDLCAVTLGPHGDKAFALRLLGMGRTRCLETYGQWFPDVSPVRVDYYYAFASAGCVGLLQRWFSEGMIAPAAELAAAAEELMRLGIGYLGGVSG